MYQYYKHTTRDDLLKFTDLVDSYIIQYSESGIAIIEDTFNSTSFEEITKKEFKHLIHNTGLIPTIKVIIE